MSRKSVVLNSNKFNFEQTIEDYLAGYRAEVVAALNDVIPGVAKDAVKKLKQTSPRAESGPHKGEYASNWKYKVARGRIKTGATVYGDKPTYRLAHLLEFGHEKRGGDRMPVKGIEHIKPVAEWAQEEAVRRMFDKLERDVGYDI